MNILLDTGCANIGSVISISNKLGHSLKITSNYRDVATASKIILPGVGHFDEGVKALKRLDLFNALKDRHNKGGCLFLGICLGMQLLCNGSEEGSLEGLGLIDADVIHLSKLVNSNIKIPHMGWNNVTIKKHSLFFKHFSEAQRFYFVHSFYVNCNNSSDILTTTQYGKEFTSSFFSNNIVGVQFHPEKSHRFGLNFFNNYFNYNV